MATSRTKRVIVDCQFPIANFSSSKLAIGNRKLEMNLWLIF
jgi:hypothetical protein